MMKGGGWLAEWLCSVVKDHGIDNKSALDIGAVLDMNVNLNLYRNLKKNLNVNRNPNH